MLVRSTTAGASQATGGRFPAAVFRPRLTTASGADAETGVVAAAAIRLYPGVLLPGVWHRTDPVMCHTTQRRNGLDGKFEIAAVGCDVTAGYLVRASRLKRTSPRDRGPSTMQPDGQDINSLTPCIRELSAQMLAEIPSGSGRICRHRRGGRGAPIKIRGTRRSEVAVRDKHKGQRVGTAGG